MHIIILFLISYNSPKDSTVINLNLFNGHLLSTVRTEHWKMEWNERLKDFGTQWTDQPGNEVTVDQEYWDPCNTVTSNEYGWQCQPWSAWERLEQVSQRRLSCIWSWRLHPPGCITEGRKYSRAQKPGCGMEYLGIAEGQGVGRQPLFWSPGLLEGTAGNNSWPSLY